MKVNTFIAVFSNRWISATLGSNRQEPTPLTTTGRVFIAQRALFVQQIGIRQQGGDFSTNSPTRDI
jgi:hypothetical protein